MGRSPWDKGILPMDKKLSEQVVFLMTEPMRNELNDLAIERKTTISGVIRSAIRKELESGKK